MVAADAAIVVERVNLNLKNQQCLLIMAQII